MTNSKNEDSLTHLKRAITDFDQLRTFLSTYKDLVDRGSLAEFYCEKLFDLDPCCSPSSQSPVKNGPYDAKTKKGERVEIKHRMHKGSTPPGMKMNFQNFEFVLYVLLDETLLPSKIWKIDRKDITQFGSQPQWDENYVGRVSFHAAIDSGSAKIVYSDGVCSQL